MSTSRIRSFEPRFSAAIWLTILCVMGAATGNAQELPTPVWRLAGGDIGPTGQPVFFAMVPRLNRALDLVLSFVELGSIRLTTFSNGRFLFRTSDPVPWVQGATVVSVPHSLVPASGVPWSNLDVNWGGERYSRMVFQGGRPVIRRDHPVGLPGFPPGSRYVSTSLAQTWHDTEAVVVASLGVPGVLPNVQAMIHITTDGAGNLLSESLLARIGAPMPGVTGNVSSLIGAIVSPGGHIAMLIGSSGPQLGVGRTTLLVDGVPQLESGYPSPVPGMSWTSLRSCAINDRGDLLVAGTIGAGPTEEWLVSLNGGVIFRESQSRPILGPFDVHSMGAFTLSSNGRATWHLQVANYTANAPISSIFVDGEPFVVAGHTIVDGHPNWNSETSISSVDQDGVYMGLATGYRVNGVPHPVAMIVPLNQATTYCAGTENSTGEVARLGAHGSPRVADGRDVEILGNGLPAGSYAVMFASRVPTMVPNPGGALGNLCVGGALSRSRPLTVSAFGAARVWLSEILAGTGSAPTVGDTWRFQCWYRDHDVSGPISRLSNAVAMDFY